MSSATLEASDEFAKAPSLPGTTGILSLFAVLIALDLFPIRSMLSERGPIKFRPCSRQIRAYWGDSERKPMPG